MEATKSTALKADTPSVVIDFLKLGAVSVAAALAFSTTASAVVLLLV